MTDKKKGKKALSESVKLAGSGRPLTQKEINQQEMTSRMKRIPVTLPKMELKKP